MRAVNGNGAKGEINGDGTIKQSIKMIVVIVIVKRPVSIWLIVGRRVGAFVTTRVLYNASLPPVIDVRKQW